MDKAAQTMIGNLHKNTGKSKDELDREVIGWIRKAYDIQEAP